MASGTRRKRRALAKVIEVNFYGCEQEIRYRIDVIVLRAVNRRGVSTPIGTISL